MSQLSLLFEKELDKMIVEGSFSKERKKKYLKWVLDASYARGMGSLDQRSNQYDKAEELITWYCFAPLLRMNEDQQIETLRELFVRIIGLNVNPPIDVSIDKMLRSSIEYMDNIAEDHPVRYIRSQIKKRKDRKRPLEGYTHIDCYIETKKYLISIEAKFMSDISNDVKYNPMRNQIARTIDVCLEEASKTGKKVIFMLLVPKLLDNPSRFYHYKMRDYQDRENLIKDLPHQIETIHEHYHSSHTIYWRDTATTIINKALKMGHINMEIESLKEFYKERIIPLNI